MPILSNCEIWFLRADPKRPNAKYNPKNPTWEVQIRTTDKEVKKAWEAMGVNVKAIIPDDGPAYFKANLKKKSIKASDKTPATPVGVVSGKGMPLDPNTVGNGSIANVRIFQYKYSQGGKEGVANVLMALQVVKHVVREARAREDDFEDCETETIVPEKEAGSDAGDDTDLGGTAAPKAPSAPKAPGASSSREF